ncbi:hypothetical protein BDQ17DRAFT_1351572 [Cyathus striatus]|nr:hypothetical protein BDQ17DRAFT_1351572 [Cyathus striatus]
MTGNSEEAIRELYVYADTATSSILPRSATSPRARTISFASAMRPTKTTHQDLSGYRYPIRSSPRRRARRDAPVSPTPSGKVYTRYSPKRKAAVRNGASSILGSLIRPITHLTRKKREYKKEKGKTGFAFWKSHSTDDVRPQDDIGPFQVGSSSTQMLPDDVDEEEYGEDFPNGPAQYLSMPTSYGVEDPFLTPARPDSARSCTMSETQSPPMTPVTNSPQSSRSARSSYYRRRQAVEHEKKRKLMSRLKAIQLLGVEASTAVRGGRWGAPGGN